MNLNDVINFIKDHLIVMITIFSLIALFIYVKLAVLLNKLNQAMYGKITWMAWIPPFNIYLLGKLTIHTIFGWILLLASLVGISVTITENGVSKTYSLLPTDIQEPYIIVISSIIVILYVYAFIKLKSLIRRNGTDSIDTLNIKNFSNLNRPFIEKKDNINQNTTNNYEQNNINVSTIKLQNINNVNNNQPSESNSIDEYNKTINSNDRENP